MSESLNEIERRVLGVLLEKSLSQPQYYPMTLNAIVAGCNQKNNRDPLMELDEEAVWNALEVLRAAGLASRLLPGGASRVERFKHDVKERLGWEKAQRAIMAELLLRGPQTIGELRGHAGRLYAFENAEAVQAVVDGLCNCAPPRVAALARQPGQAAARFAHRLYTPEEWAKLAFGPPADTPRAGAEPAASAAPASALADMQSQIGELQAAIADLRLRISALEGEAARGAASYPGSPP